MTRKKTSTPLAIVAALATTTALALTGCVAGEGSPAAMPRPRPPEGWSASVLNIDFATYNPLSLIIKDQGWIEDAVGDDVTVNWIQSAGSNKANEALRAGAIDVGSTAGSAALLARSNGSPIKVIDIYSQPNWAAILVPAGSAITDGRGPQGQAHRRHQGHRPVLLPAAGARGGRHRPRRGDDREPPARGRQGRPRVRCRRRLVGSRPAAVDERRDRRLEDHLRQHRLQQLRLPERDGVVPREEPGPRPARRERLREGPRLRDRRTRTRPPRSSPRSPASTSRSRRPSSRTAQPRGRPGARRGAAQGARDHRPDLRRERRRREPGARSTTRSTPCSSRSTPRQPIRMPSSTDSRQVAASAEGAATTAYQFASSLRVLGSRRRPSTSTPPKRRGRGRGAGGSSSAARSSRSRSSRPGGSSPTRGAVPSYRLPSPQQVWAAARRPRRRPASSIATSPSRPSAC